MFDVRPRKACPWCADGAVPEKLGRYHVGGACGQLEGVVDEVPANGDADTVGILLLWLMVDDNMSTCDGPVFGDALDFVVGKKKYGVSHLGNTGLELGQAMYFLAHCWHPHVLQVRIVLEFAILSDCLLGDRVDDAKTVVFKVDKWAGPLQLGGHLGGLQGHHVVYGLEQYVARPQASVC